MPQARAFVAGEVIQESARMPPAFSAAWLLAFSIPWDDMILLPGDVQFARVLGVVVTILWLASILRGGVVRRPNSAHAWMAAFILWASISIFWSVEPDRTVRRSFSYLQLFMIGWVIYQFALARRYHLRLLQAFLLGEWVLIAFVFYAFWNGEIWGEGRYTAPGVNPNDLAGTLAIGVPFAAYLAVAGSRRWAWLNAIYVPAAVAGVVLNASRSGLLAVFVALLFPLALISRVSWKTRLAAAAVIVAGFLVETSVTDTVSLRRLSTIGEQIATRDLNGRMDVWATAQGLFYEDPFAGVGAGTFSTATGSIQAQSLAGHNSFLEVLVEGGAIGFGIYICILFTLARCRYRAGSMETQLWIVVLLTWTMINMANSWENKNVTWLLWGLALGYPAAVRVPANITDWLPQPFSSPARIAS